METPLSFFLLQWLHGFALWLLSSVHIALALAVTLHALMKKEEVHKAVSWIGLAWLAPFGGALPIGCWASTVSGAPVWRLVCARLGKAKAMRPRLLSCRAMQ